MLEERTIGGLHAALLPQVVTLEGIAHDSAILDLACGTGAWLKRLHDAGYRNLWGVDRDVEHFEAHDVAHYIAADLDEENCALKVGVPDFALITAIEIIEHVANPERLIALAVTALAPRGWLLITTPNIYSLRARLRFLVSARVPYFERLSARVPIELDHAHPLILEAYQRKIFDPLGLTLVRVWSHPELASDGSRWFARLTMRVLRLVVRDELPGDCLCLLLRKP